MNTSTPDTQTVDPVVISLIPTTNNQEHVFLVPRMFPFLSKKEEKRTITVKYFEFQPSVRKPAILIVGFYADTGLTYTRKDLAEVWFGKEIIVSPGVDEEIIKSTKTVFHHMYCPGCKKHMKFHPAVRILRGTASIMKGLCVETSVMGICHSCDDMLPIDLIVEP